MGVDCEVSLDGSTVISRFLLFGSGTLFSEYLTGKFGRLNGAQQVSFIRKRDTVFGLPNRL